MLATVLIPTYNRPRLLREAIESAIELGGPRRVQIIVVADGCHEAAPAVQPYLNRIDFLKLDERSGQSAALNAALTYTKGEFLTVLHDDDRAFPNKIEDLLPPFREDNRVGIACALSQTIGRTGDLREDWNEARIAAMRNRHRAFPGGFVGERSASYIDGAAALYRTSIIREIGGWNPALQHGEEVDLHLRIIAAGWKVRFVDSIVSQYRIHDGNKCRDEAGTLYPSARGVGSLLRESYRPPIWASVCSIPRRKIGLRDTVAAILPQCDQLNVFLAGYEARPGFLNHPKIRVVSSGTEGDRGTVEKFRWLENLKALGGGYYLTVDDDVLYPPDYVEELCFGIRRHADKALCAFHGSRFREFPVRNYFKNRVCYHFKEAVEADERVHIIGNVAAGFHSAAFDLRPDHFSTQHLSDDSAVSIAAQSAGVPAIVLKHRAGWIVPNAAPGCESGLYDIYSKGNPDIDATINAFGGWLCEVAA